MSVITIIKKIGERILSVVEFPFQHSVQVAKLIESGIQDEPELRTALVGLVQQFEALGPDVTAAIAANGLNLPEDLKSAADIKSLFTFYESTLKPAIEKTVGDVKADMQTSSTATATTDPAPVQAGPGLHTVVTA